MNKVPANELKLRMESFHQFMNEMHPNWKIAVIFSNIHLYYFTGTMQKGMLMIERQGNSVFWVLRSYERALDESEFFCIKPMASYREAAKEYSYTQETIYMETEMIPIGYYNRFNNYFGFSQVESIDKIIAKLRSVKSEYELSLMKISGEIHRKVLEEYVPTIIKEGMSELDLASKVWNLLVDEGHHGISRIGMFDTEMLFGIVSFGENSLYPTNFNGPGGNKGISPPVPLLASRERKLVHGDLIYVDIGCGYNGYQTDKTMIYSFGVPQEQAVIDVHNQCVQIQDDIASLLKPGAIPSEIYHSVIQSLDVEFIKDFMGYGNRAVNFLGHGIGLWIDETPVIAKGFNEPIQENMIFALEPKKGIKGVGMVGIENTFCVKKEGGVCLTGNHKDLLTVY